MNKLQSLSVCLCAVLNSAVPDQLSLRIRSELTATRQLSLHVTFGLTAASYKR